MHMQRLKQRRNGRGKVVIQNLRKEKLMRHKRFRLTVLIR
jgi:hypothetical protein